MSVPGELAELTAREVAEPPAESAAPARVALVTGASSGIGRATALALARDGFAVALLARREARLRALADDIARSGGRALALAADVTALAAARRAVDRTLETWGRVDVLVNNAGRGLLARVEDTTPGDLRALLETNVVAVLELTRAVLPHMRRQGGGHVINVASIVGRRAVPLRAAYSATKFALVALSEALRLEVAGSGIRVSVVLPGVTETEFHAAEPRRGRERFHGPVQSAERVARAIAGCVRRPRAEVYPFPLARLLGPLAALAPGLADRVLRRMYRRELAPLT